MCPSCGSHDLKRGEQNLWCNANNRREKSVHTGGKEGGSMEGLIWVVELRSAADDWRPFKMYCDKEKAERKLRRLQQFQSVVLGSAESNWRVSCYARHPECKVT